MQNEYDYIVVGSGAGGGTVAARLAENGARVLVLESGGDPLKLMGSDAVAPHNRSEEDYRVPVFHAFSTENEAVKWDFFVRHYSDDERQAKDPKYTVSVDGREVKGVLYPRAGCLGGCTAHNAMITVYPHNADWDHVAELTGDDSWRASNMRRYFQKLENCRYRPGQRLLAKLGLDRTRHGYDGWLHTEAAFPLEALAKDKPLVECILDSVKKALKELPQHFDRVRWALKSRLDPNDWRLVRDNATGLRFTPLANRKHERMGTRERLLEVQEKHPGQLSIELNSLVTRVLLDENRRAVGVEYMKGERLYRACHQFSDTEGERYEARASKEVILSCGAFNTPQILMLSGVGPREELEKHGIEVKVELPGVGRNLQDRYEVGVVNRMSRPWKVLEGARYAKGDPQYQEWATKREGVYTTNGAVLAVIKRSVEQRPLPDLFCFALLGLFRGYFPGYSRIIAENLNYLTWCVLKAHTNNTAGYVSLRSADARDTPYINFRYFDEGNDSSQDDLKSVVDGIRFVRKLAAPLKEQGLIEAEELPGEAVQSDAELAEFVKNQAWGHHASCTCPIGADGDPMAVLTSDFRVRGTQGLRVVDASMFPRIPGFFIVSSIYVAAEKAADVILEQHAADAA